MSLINLLFAARAALQGRRERQRAYAELAALDNHSLADIGLHRSQIPAIVEGLHEAVQLDAAPRLAAPSLRPRNTGLTAAQEWLRSV